MNHTKTLEPAPPVTCRACPFCRSDRVTTTSKPATTASYWRCGSCGQVWNPSRLQSSPPRRW